MNENVIEWFSGDNKIRLTLARGKLCNRVKRLAISNPEDVTILSYNKDGSCYAEIPLPYLKIKAPSKRNYTEEEKQAVSDRLRTSRNNIKSGCTE